MNSSDSKCCKEDTKKETNYLNENEIRESVRLHKNKKVVDVKCSSRKNHRSRKISIDYKKNENEMTLEKTDCIKPLVKKCQSENVKMYKWTKHKLKEYR